MNHSDHPSLLPIAGLLITGATDGIGLETAKMLAPLGHTLALHGRSAIKLEAAAKAVAAIDGAGAIKTYRVDLSILDEVRSLALQIKGDFDTVDVLINNAAVFKMPNPKTSGLNSWVGRRNVRECCLA